MVRAKCDARPNIILITARQIALGVNEVIMKKYLFYHINSPFYWCVLGMMILTGKVELSLGQNKGTYHFTIEQAITQAKSRNKWVQMALAEQQASVEDLKDIHNNGLPNINVNGSYQRFSELTLYTEGLGKASSGPRKPTPNSAALGTEASFNLYNGGKQKAAQNESRSRLEIAEVNSHDQAAGIGLQTALNYLEQLRIAELRRFITDQLKRAEVRLGNINALYRNQKVTRSDVLRAEVARANVSLALDQNKNDFAIGNQLLSLLLDLPDTASIELLDSAKTAAIDMVSLRITLENMVKSSYTLQRSSKGIELQQARIKGLLSGNRPGVSLYGGYGLNYPNYLFFPPVDQAYSIGFLGIKAQYNISSLYQNKHKVAAGKVRLKELEIQHEGYEDHVRTELKAYFIRYDEAISRIAVNEKSVEQARVNYEIVNKKYLNQLSLLTDLLDADNLYQESRFNLVKAQTDAAGIYYRILYTSGKL